MVLSWDPVWPVSEAGRRLCQAGMMSLERTLARDDLREEGPVGIFRT